MREKSCGTIPYTVRNGQIYYALVTTKSRNFYGFPKGHVEDGESEAETALRETYEETALRPTILPGFRHDMIVPLENGNDKLVVYFTADFGEQTPRNVDGFENYDYVIMTYEEAFKNITFDAVRDMLVLANKFLTEKLK